MKAEQIKGPLLLLLLIRNQCLKMAACQICCRNCNQKAMQRLGPWDCRLLLSPLLRLLVLLSEFSCLSHNNLSRSRKPCSLPQTWGGTRRMITPLSVREGTQASLISSISKSFRYVYLHSPSLCFNTGTATKRETNNRLFHPRW